MTTKRIELIVTYDTGKLETGEAESGQPYWDRVEGEHRKVSRFTKPTGLDEDQSRLWDSQVVELATAPLVAVAQGHGLVLDGEIEVDGEKRQGWFVVRAHDVIDIKSFITDSLDVTD